MTDMRTAVATLDPDHTERRRALALIARLLRRALSLSHRS